jgi:hypothetical protein
MYISVLTKQPPIVGNLAPTFADRGFCMVSTSDPHGLILDFLDQSRYFFFQAAPQLYSQG